MNFSKKTKLFRSRKGFTLIEVMVAAIIFGLTSFALLALLRAGDQLALRARINGAVATQVKARGTLLATLSFNDTAQLNGSYYRGSLGTVIATPVLPPILSLASDELASEIPYLIKGKPLPGSTTPRDLAPYLETIFITGTNPGSSVIYYTIEWIDPVGLYGTSNKKSLLSLTFFKNDPNRY